MERQRYLYEYDVDEHEKVKCKECENEVYKNHIKNHYLLLHPDKKEARYKKLQIDRVPSVVQETKKSKEGRKTSKVASPNKSVAREQKTGPSASTSVRTVVEEKANRQRPKEQAVLVSVEEKSVTHAVKAKVRQDNRENCNDCNRSMHVKSGDFKRILIDKETPQHEWFTIQDFRNVFTFDSNTLFCHKCVLRETSYYTEVHEKWKENNRNYKFLPCPKLANRRGTSSKQQAEEWRILKNQTMLKNEAMNTKLQVRLERCHHRPVQNETAQWEENNEEIRFEGANALGRHRMIIESDTESDFVFDESLPVFSSSSVREAMEEDQGTFRLSEDEGRSDVSSRDEEAQQAAADKLRRYQEEAQAELDDLSDTPLEENEPPPRTDKDEKSYSQKCMELNDVFANDSDMEGFCMDDDELEKREERYEEAKNKPKSPTSLGKSFPDRKCRDPAKMATDCDNETRLWIQSRMAEEKLIGIADDSRDFISDIECLINDLKVVNRNTHWIAVERKEILSRLYENAPEKKINTPVECLEHVVRLLREHDAISEKSKKQVEKYNKLIEGFKELKGAQPVVDYLSSEKIREMVKTRESKTQVNDVSDFLAVYSRSLRELAAREGKTIERGPCSTRHSLEGSRPTVTVLEMQSFLGLTTQDFCENISDRQRKHLGTDAQGKTDVVTKDLDKPFREAGCIIGADISFRNTVRPLLMETVVFDKSKIVSKGNELYTHHSILSLEDGTKLSELSKEVIVELVMTLKNDKKVSFLRIDTEKVIEELNGFILLEDTNSTTNQHRVKMLGIAVESLAAQVEKDLMADFKLRAHDVIAESCAAKLTALLDQPEMEIKYDDFKKKGYCTKHGLRVWAISYFDDEARMDLINEEGESELISKIKTSSITTHNKELKKDIHESFGKEIDSKRPHIIAVNGKNREAFIIQQVFQKIVDEKAENNEMPAILTIIVDGGYRESLAEENRSIVNLLKDPAEEVSRHFDAHNNFTMLDLHPYQLELETDLSAKLEGVMMTHLINKGLKFEDAHQLCYISCPKPDFEIIQTYVEQESKPNCIYYKEPSRMELMEMMTKAPLETHMNRIYNARVMYVPRTLKVKEPKEGVEPNYYAVCCKVTYQEKQDLEEHLKKCEANMSGLKVWITDIDFPAFIPRKLISEQHKNLRSQVGKNIDVQILQFKEKEFNFIAKTLENQYPERQTLKVDALSKTTTRLCWDNKYREMFTTEVNDILVKDPALPYLVHPHDTSYTKLYLSFKINPYLIKRVEILEKDKKYIGDVGSRLCIGLETFPTIDQIERNYVDKIQLYANELYMDKNCIGNNYKDEHCNSIKKHFEDNTAAEYCISFEIETPGVVIITHEGKRLKLNNIVEINNDGYNCRNRIYKSKRHLFDGIAHFNKEDEKRQEVAFQIQEKISTLPVSKWTEDSDDDQSSNHPVASSSNPAHQQESTLTKNANRVQRPNEIPHLQLIFHGELSPSTRDFDDEDM